ncbi:MAG: DUF58 domain-containing protein [Chloroflexota bacterium]
MLTSETLRKIRLIELRTRRLVETSFAGAYHSVFKGRGIVFDEVRPYMPGDDVRDIDWNVTARAGEPFIKRYREERELTVLLVLDTSASIMFGTVERQKRDMAAELGAVLALSAISNNDKVGMLLFSDTIETFVPPRKGRKHVLRMIRDLLAAEPAQTGTDLSLALKTVNRVLDRKSIVFLISDFLADAETYQRDLQVLGRKHDLITVVASDPLEKDFPRSGLVTVEDAETGEVQIIDTSAGGWHRGFMRRTAKISEERDAALKDARADRIELSVDGDYVSALAAFFNRRSQRLK